MIGRDELWQVTAPYYCAALIVRDEVVVDAAPILRWTVGKRMGDLVPYFARKRFAFALVQK